jgi:predicted nucleic acid-binding protein
VIVVDANLLVYLWTGGQGATLAESVARRDPQWIAPILWRSEFRNAVVNLTRARRLTPDRALVLTREAELQMAGREYTVESHSVLALAQRSRCSTYDCEYVALAEDLDVPLVSFDRDVTRAFPDRVITPETFIRD